MRLSINKVPVSYIAATGGIALVGYIGYRLVRLILEKSGCIGRTNSLKSSIALNPPLKSEKQLEKPVTQSAPKPAPRVDEVAKETIPKIAATQNEEPATEIIEESSPQIIEESEVVLISVEDQFQEALLKFEFLAAFNHIYNSALLDKDKYYCILFEKAIDKFSIKFAISLIPHLSNKEKAIERLKTFFNQYRKPQSDDEANSLINLFCLLPGVHEDVLLNFERFELSYKMFSDWFTTYLSAKSLEMERSLYDQLLWKAVLLNEKAAVEEEVVKRRIVVEEIDFPYWFECVKVLEKSENCPNVLFALLDYLEQTVSKGDFDRGIIVAETISSLLKDISQLGLQFLAFLCKKQKQHLSTIKVLIELHAQLKETSSTALIFSIAKIHYKTDLNEFIQQLKSTGKADQAAEIEAIVS
jgi:hypothetical protein